MLNKDHLNSFVGKNIDQICGNKFHNPAENHCAHFVSHVCNLTFDYNCKQYKGGTKAGANIRVHEVFAKCPKVGHWRDADKTMTQLAFVTLETNVDVSQKTMVNIPQKHIGIFHQGTVYHYGNTLDKVTTDTPETFLQKFEAIYDGKQGLFFGWIPGSDLALNVVEQGAQATAERKFDLPPPQGGVWKARAVGEADWLYVGKEVNQPGPRYHGLYVPGANYWGPKYSAAAYGSGLDHWAVLLEISGACESENHFTLINTYDRAKFTFGFYQLAAHTPRDNLILLFRELAELPAFNAYFPDLKMHNGSLHRIDTSGASTNLETEFQADNGEMQIMNFMNYLNPNRKLIDPQEALQAARLMHWAANDPAARAAQVRVAARIMQEKMAKRHAPKLKLDGKSDVICAIVADIFHQGRSTYAAVRTILEGANSEKALLKVGEAAYPERIQRLTAAISQAKAAGQLGQKRYSLAANGFG